MQLFTETVKTFNSFDNILHYIANTSFCSPWHFNGDNSTATKSTLYFECRVLKSEDWSHSRLHLMTFCHCHMTKLCIVYVLNRSLDLLYKHWFEKIWNFYMDQLQVYYKSLKAREYNYFALVIDRNLDPLIKSSKIY